MAERSLPDRSAGDSKPLMERIIPAIGVVFILVSVFVACFYSASFLFLAIAVVLFSIGFVALWFGYINPAVRSGEERIYRINSSADKVLQRLAKRKK